MNAIRKIGAMSVTAILALMVLLHGLPDPEDSTGHAGGSSPRELLGSNATNSVPNSTATVTRPPQGCNWQPSERDFNNRRLMYVSIYVGVSALLMLSAFAVEATKMSNPAYKATVSRYSPNDDIPFACATYGIIASFFVVMILTFIAVPLGAFLSGTISCTDGIWWELHTIVFVIVMVGKEFEVIVYAWQPRKGIGFVKVAMKFITSLLALLDLYTDICFIFIAAACGSMLWIPSIFVILGVGCCQFGPLALLLCSGFAGNGERMTVLAKMVSFDMLFELAPREDRDDQTSSGIGPELQLLQSVARCVSEDFVQMIIQICFVVQQGKNWQVIISIVVGFLCSMATVAYALYVMGFFSEHDAEEDADDEDLAAVDYSRES